MFVRVHGGGMSLGRVFRSQIPGGRNVMAAAAATLGGQNRTLRALRTGALRGRGRPTTHGGNQMMPCIAGDEKIRSKLSVATMSTVSTGEN